MSILHTVRNLFDVEENNDLLPKLNDRDSFTYNHKICTKEFTQNERKFEQ